MRNIVLGTVAAIAMLIVAGTASAAFKIGDKISTRFYCTSESAARTISKIIAVKGHIGYLAIVKNRRSGCKDAVQTPALRLNATLLKRLWTTKVPGPAGVTLQFWKVRDPKGVIYYTFNILQK